MKLRDNDSLQKGCDYLSQIIAILPSEISVLSANFSMLRVKINASSDLSDQIEFH
jgi:hypothetical protein